MPLLPPIVGDYITLSVELDQMAFSVQDARQRFRAVLVEATVKLDEVVKKIRKPVDDSKPYWEARRVARQVRYTRTPRCGDCVLSHCSTLFGSIELKKPYWIS